MFTSGPSLNASKLMNSPSASRYWLMSMSSIKLPVYSLTTNESSEVRFWFRMTMGNPNISNATTIRIMKFQMSLIVVDKSKLMKAVVSKSLSQSKTFSIISMLATEATTLTELIEKTPKGW